LIYLLIIVKKTYQFTTSFKDDICQLADLKQQISQKITVYFGAES